MDALVTGPVTKWAIKRAGVRFTGQTEYFMQATRTARVTMMFASEHLKVALLTRHQPLMSVARSLSRRDILATLEQVLDGLRQHFGLRQPSVAVCGLNPHAGERGLFGTEEQRLLAPVLAQLRRRGAHLTGPLAADGLFASPRCYDAVVCWYHDQALIPFKLLARDTGCQVSLGLPFVRTSPDHGSALDIAGRGAAHPGSMRYALALACRMAAGPSARC
jgi:4-hydroxythreonine-4-phosphate dehydrogenase